LLSNIDAKKTIPAMRSTLSAISSAQQGCAIEQTVLLAWTNFEALLERTATYRMI
jgi:hypothetical protein